MSGETKLMKWGILLAAAIIVLRIALEQFGAPDSVCKVFGVAWLYFLFPVLFAIQIRAQKDSRPFRRLLKNVILFAPVWTGQSVQSARNSRSGGNRTQGSKAAMRSQSQKPGPV
jgi:thiol:disulfide interchange protein